MSRDLEPLPAWLGIMAWVFFALTVIGGVYVIALEFSSPQLVRPKQTKPWLDR